jgi:hypothetical protein
MNAAGDLYTPKRLYEDLCGAGPASARTGADGGGQRDGAGIALASSEVNSAWLS